VKTCGDHGGTTIPGKPCSRKSDGLCYQHGGEGKSGGRPRVTGNLSTEDGSFSQKDLDRIERYAASLKVEEIAHFFGISERTLYRRIEEDPRVMAAYQKGRARAKLSIASSIIQDALQGDNACRFFWMKTQGGWHETRRSEVTGADGGPVDLAPTVVELVVPAYDDE